MKFEVKAAPRSRASMADMTPELPLYCILRKSLRTAVVCGNGLPGVSLKSMSMTANAANKIESSCLVACNEAQSCSSGGSAEVQALCKDKGGKRWTLVWAALLLNHTWVAILCSIQYARVALKKRCLP